MRLADTEEAEEEGWWEGMERTTTKGIHMGRGDYEYDDYSLTNPESEAVAALSNLKPAILFAFGGKEAIGNAFGCTELAFSVVAWGHLFPPVHWCRYQQICGDLGGGEIFPRRKMLREGRQEK